MAKRKEQEHKWPASQIEQRSLDELTPYINNPREHSDAQVKKIAASMLKWGWTVPCLIDPSGELIAGHGRCLAAQSLVDQGHARFGTVPVMVARGWSGADKRAYRIADNQLALSSAWDEGRLKLELGELSADGFALDVLGFDLPELQGLMGEGAPEEPERELSDVERALLNSAWRKMLAEWQEIMNTAMVRGYASTTYTKGSLAVAFMRAQLLGVDIPRAATLPYTLHRLETVSFWRQIAELPEFASKDDSALKSLQWAVGNRISLDQILSGLAIRGRRLPADFPALLARDLINEFCPKGGSVLDPCHGWGGRALGFLLSHAGAYTGFDTDQRTSRGVSDMLDDLAEFVEPRKDVYLLCEPFEDAVLQRDAADFALTSPPYYDVEKYGGEESSWQRYNTFDAWVDGFYRPLISKVATALKPDGVFALQIGSQRYPLEKTALKIGKEIGLTPSEIRDTSMVNSQMPSEEGDGERIIIFRKIELHKNDPASKFGRVL
ncbi:MAG: hypothetical protein EPO00_13375 [Chloroflexota bacterium]|nr:MAG: hypothetical protein EPO00_13375 [Chloroflexota bacterium]